jgi:hypothetical protein
MVALLIGRLVALHVGVERGHLVGAEFRIANR